MKCGLEATAVSQSFNFPHSDVRTFKVGTVGAPHNPLVLKLSAQFTKNPVFKQLLFTLYVLGQQLQVMLYSVSITLPIT
jgi:hypothetical protein